MRNEKIKFFESYQHFSISLLVFLLALFSFFLFFYLCWVFFYLLVGRSFSHVPINGRPHRSICAVTRRVQRSFARPTNKFVWNDRPSQVKNEVEEFLYFWVFFPSIDFQLNFDRFLMNRNFQRAGKFSSSCLEGLLFKKTKSVHFCDYFSKTY